jgi:hypothetical protein
MSAEAIHLVCKDLSDMPYEKPFTGHQAEHNLNVVNKLPLQARYQLYFAPEPTPEQIALEEFLLDCD